MRGSEPQAKHTTDAYDRLTAISIGIEDGRIDRS